MVKKKKIGTLGGTGVKYRITGISPLLLVNKNWKIDPSVAG